MFQQRQDNTGTEKAHRGHEGGSAKIGIATRRITQKTNRRGRATPKGHRNNGFKIFFSKFNFISEYIKIFY